MSENGISVRTCPDSDMPEARPGIGEPVDTFEGPAGTAPPAGTDTEVAADIGTAAVAGIDTVAVAGIDTAAVADTAAGLQEIRTWAGLVRTRHSLPAESEAGST